MPADIAITGIGVVSPIGVGRDAYAASLADGRSGVGPFTGFDPSALPFRIAAEVRDYDAREFVKPRKALKMMSRDIELSYGAAKLAVQDARLGEGGFDPERLAVVFGADMIYPDVTELVDVYRACLVDGKFQWPKWGEAAMRELNPLWMLKYLPNMPACQIGIALDARGPNNSIVQGEVSSLLAIAEGVRVIERGAADLVLVGGGSTRLHPSPVIFRQGAYMSLRNDEPEKASRPFDNTRDGQVIGEGAAAFVIERLEHAQHRGASVLARIRGCGNAFSPTSAAQPVPTVALRRAASQALEEAGMSPSELGHVNAHGWSTREHDPGEAEAIRDLAGDVPVTAPKSFFGNLGAAGGAVELVASILAIQSGEIPLTLNYERPDPACPVNVVHGEPRRAASSSALALNYTSMGNAAAMVLCGE